MPYHVLHPEAQGYESPLRLPVNIYITNTKVCITCHRLIL